MSYKKYNIIFGMLEITILLLFYLTYIYKEIIFIYTIISISMFMLLFNLIYIRKIKLEGSLKFIDYEIYNLDKFIMGVLAFITLFIFDSEIPRENIYQISYFMFTLSFFSSLRIRKLE